MKQTLISLAMSSGFLSAQVVLFSDNFNAPDIGNLDQSDQTGRRSGLVPDIQVRSSRVQHGIVDNQLNFLDVGSGRIRFHDDPDNDTTTAGIWHDWAAGQTGSLILSNGGLIVEFDWNAGKNDTPDWVSINMGHSGPGTAEPLMRVNQAETDIGMLFRYNGDTELFDNGVNLGAQGSFNPTIGIRHIKMEYSFDSFEDGTTVTLVASIDGTEVYNGSPFTWENNGGSLYFEIGNNDPTLIDNLTISAPGLNSYLVDLDEKEFRSGEAGGALIGELSATNEGNPETSTFTLVAGDGDTDNDKFQINGSRLEVGAFDFTSAANGDQFSIRVLGTGTSNSGEGTIVLTLINDDDLDNLVDDWELRWAPDLTVLSGALGSENADGDAFTDLEEFQISRGEYPMLGAYPGIDPTKEDSDGDGLVDGEELVPTGTRPVTDPGNVDTDFDGLSDLVETNTGTFINETNTGTNPALCDTDLDFARDGWEITENTSPLDIASYPEAASSSVSIVRLTDDASTEISSDKTYTHAISGGTAASVNGVFFEQLNNATLPTNFIWETAGNTMDAVLENNGDWLPFDGGVTGPGLLELLGSFTYSGSGAAPNSTQRYTLTNLTPGENYDLRLYVRVWDTEGSGRPIDLVFTNGTEIVQPFGALPEDRPGVITRTGNDHDAYFLNFNYTAQGTELVIDANLHPCNPAVSGSNHLYALTNEVSTNPLASGITITDSTFAASGVYVIAFQARPDRTYRVTRSANLSDPFEEFSPSLAVTTDFNGAGQAIIPANQVSGTSYFYRIEE